ncbi:MAG: (Fe-S)-binding protein [Firmicutes bacterium]|nr:(Fe-S)-binding protein [Bacillota bacterium]
MAEARAASTAAVAQGSAQGGPRAGIFPPAALEAMDVCIKCGFCLPSCPTYLLTGNELHSPRGRIHLAEEAERGSLPISALAESFAFCVHCRACESACPSGVHYTSVLTAARAALRAARADEAGVAGRGRAPAADGAAAPEPKPAADGAAALERAPAPLPRRPLWVRRLEWWLLRVFAPHPAVWTLGRWALWAWRRGPDRLARRLGWLRRLPWPLGELEAVLPDPAARRQEGAAALPHAAGRAAAPAACCSFPPPAAFFRGCVSETLFRSANEAARRALEAAGWTVAVPAGQTCCGALHANAGDLEAARRLARRNIEAFERAPGPIVSTAGGCGAHMREYPALFAGDAAWRARAEAFAARVRDVSQLLREAPLTARSVAGPAGAGPAAPHGPVALRADSAGAPPERRPLRVAYVDSCHLRHGQKVAREPRDVLDRLPGVERVELPEADLCCGSGGTYTFSQPGASAALGERKAAHVRAAGVEVVVVANPGCYLQMLWALRRAGLSGVRVMHLAELAAERLAAVPEAAAAPAPAPAPGEGEG